ncbi:hypothetical protein CEXT_53121 [Caerostris extrusa]|uniref:Uncharacterized protein n=1 Tax=Caerostris extrusa TaxID=172846 RepID=A0AAV4MNG4_CAEEX|nr:hypothetical protein CEXT_53121 [Caerostris extrusa]
MNHEINNSNLISVKIHTESPSEGHFPKPIFQLKPKKSIKWLNVIPFTVQYIHPNRTLCSSTQWTFANEYGTFIMSNPDSKASFNNNTIQRFIPKNEPRKLPFCVLMDDNRRGNLEFPGIQHYESLEHHN